MNVAKPLLPSFFTPMSLSTTFLRRAQLEAERYGADPWVFVREFTQNARDADASHVQIRVAPIPGGTTLTFQDDGEGMSWEHAKRYLFSLYSSSKSDDVRTVGKFGVGFWSHLRIKPTRVHVRSRPRQGLGWSIAIDGALETARRADYDGPPGTQIELHLKLPLSLVREAVEDTARQTVRYIRTLRGDAPLQVHIQGESINVPFALPSPSRPFFESSLRGVIALGRSPRVELFSRGIRVRAASCLNDLLRDHPKLSYSRLRFSSLPGGLAPVALLEVDNLELELSRSDVKNSSNVARAVKMARRQLERLVVEQLDAFAPPSALERLRGWLGDVPIGGTQGRRRVLIGVSALAIGVFIAGTLAYRASPLAALPALVDASNEVSPQTLDAAASLPERALTPMPYEDFRASYRGPSSHIAGLAASYQPLNLRHSSKSRVLHLAMLRIDRDPLGIPIFGSPDRPAPAVSCERGCIKIAVKIKSKGGFLPLPTPTGMGVLPESIRLREAPLEGRVLTDRASMPMVELPGPTSGILTYTVGPLAPSLLDQSSERGAHPYALPRNLRTSVEAARALPHDQRVWVLLDEVRSLVRYDLAPEVSSRHQALTASELGPLDRLLRVGAGDCDLQNGLLTALLRQADVPARMAVGYLTHDGRPRPFVHAWVEWRDSTGVWRIADASASEMISASRPLPLRDLSASVGDRAADPPRARESPVGQPGSALRVIPPERASPLPTSSTPNAPRLIAVTVLLCLSLSFLIALMRRRKPMGGDPPEILEFIRGLLSRPQILYDLPVLATRPLVRTLSGRRISISRCRALANEARLFIAPSGASSAVVGSRMRGDILDDGYASSRLVATMMDAQDLEWWHRVMKAGRSTPLLCRVEASLRVMAPCEIVVVEGQLHGISVVDRRCLMFSLAPKVGVAVDVEHPVYERAQALYERHPALAVSILTEAITASLPSDPTKIRDATTITSRDALSELSKELP